MPVDRKKKKTGGEVRRVVRAKGVGRRSASAWARRLMMGKDAARGRESRENRCPRGVGGVHRGMEKTNEEEKDEKEVFGMVLKGR
jgi:hypothetical protein